MRNGWRQGCLQEFVADFIVPQRDKPKTFEGTIPWCRIEDIEGVWLSKSKSGKCVSEKTIREMPLRIFPKNTVIVSCSADLGRCAITSQPLVTNQTFIGLVPKTTLEPLFLYYLMTNRAEELNREATGATIKYLSQDKFRKLSVSIPSLNEQKRIVQKLDEAFAGIAKAKENAEKNLQNARALFESRLEAVFTQRGPGWVETTLSRATHGIFTGPFGSLLHKSDYILDGIPLVNPAHISEAGIEPDMRKTVSKATALRLKSYTLREGDIVIGRRGEMGRCALVTKVEDGWLCGTGSFFIKPSSQCDTRYLVRFLRSDSCKARLEKVAGGAVMPNLSNTDLGNLTLNLPPLDQQKAIVKEVDTLHEETQRLVRLYAQKLEALDSLKKSILHEAFSGNF